MSCPLGETPDDSRITCKLIPTPVIVPMTEGDMEDESAAPNSVVNVEETQEGACEPTW